MSLKMQIDVLLLHHIMHLAFSYVVNVFKREYGGDMVNKLYVSGFQNKKKRTQNYVRKCIRRVRSDKSVTISGIMMLFVCALCVPALNHNII